MTSPALLTPSFWKTFLSFAGQTMACFIGSILIWSSTAFADDPPVGWGTKIWPPVPIELELPSFCSAFATTPEEDRFLAGFHDGRVLSVSLPDGEWTEIAKFDAEVRTIAFDPYTSTIGVVTSDRRSELKTVALLPAGGGDPVVIDQRTGCLASIPLATAGDFSRHDSESSVTISPGFPSAIMMSGGICGKINMAERRWY